MSPIVQACGLLNGSKKVGELVVVCLPVVSACVLNACGFDMQNPHWMKQTTRTTLSQQTK